MESFNELKSALSRGDNVLSRLPDDVQKNIMHNVLIDDRRFYRDANPPLNYDIPGMNYWNSVTGIAPRDVEVPDSFESLGIIGYPRDLGLQVGPRGRFPMSMQRVNVMNIDGRRDWEYSEAMSEAREREKRMIKKRRM